MKWSVNQHLLHANVTLRLRALQTESTCTRHETVLTFPRNAGTTINRLRCLVVTSALPRDTRDISSSGARWATISLTCDVLLSLQRM